MPPKKPRPAGPPRVYLLWGQEELRKREALDRLIEERVPPEDRDLDVQYLDAGNAGITGETILHAARDRAMFSERRVVVLLNAGRLRASRHQRTQEVLAEGLGSLPEYSTLVLLAGAEDVEERRGARNPFGEKLMAAIKAAGEARQFTLLKPDELAQLAVGEAAAAGKQMAVSTAAGLVQRVGTDSHLLLQETRKLVAYVGDRPRIVPADVAEMVPPPPDENIFRLLDAAMTGNRQQALGVLRQLRESGTSVPQMLVMLARTLRQVAQAKYLLENRVSPSAEGDTVPPDVLAALPEDGSLYRGSRSSWVRGKLWDQARGLSWDHLHRGLDRLAAADAGTKGWEHGVEDPDLALEVFVISLCEGVQAGAPRAARPAR